MHSSLVLQPRLFNHRSQCVIQAIINESGNNWQGFPFLFALCTLASLVIWFCVNVEKGRRDVPKKKLSVNIIKHTCFHPMARYLSPFGRGCPGRGYACKFFYSINIENYRLTPPNSQKNPVRVDSSQRLLVFK